MADPKPAAASPGGWRSRWRGWSRGKRIGAWIAGILVALFVVALLVSYLFDEPLRRELEGKMNQSLHGYSVHLGHAHAGLLGLTLTLRDLVVRQQANPEPPVANIPRLKASVQWRELLTLHLVGDVLFDHPRLQVNLPQLESESKEHESPEARGWQPALESIFPLKFNSFRVREGNLVYIDQDPHYPLEISHWMLTANNIRNIHLQDRVYPSPLQSSAVIFGTGHVLIDGHANFLSAPFPGIHAVYRLQDLPLDRLQPLGARSNLEIKGGKLTSAGEVEYGPRYRSVDVANILLDGVSVDYVHTAATAAAERRRGEAVVAAAKQAAAAPEMAIRLGQFHLTRGKVGYVDRSKAPGYRLYIDEANLDVLNLSNQTVQARQSQPATAELHGRFMGSGTAHVTVKFKPDNAVSDLGTEVAIEKASLPALNDLLRTYQNVDVSAGTFSLYAQLTIKDRYVRGYVKPLIEGVQVYDPQKDAKKPLGTRVKEKVLGGLAKLLTNRENKQVATRTEVAGPLDSPHSSILQIIVGLLRNAFIQALRPGFEHGGAAASPPAAAKP